MNLLSEIAIATYQSANDDLAFIHWRSWADGRSLYGGSGSLGALLDSSHGGLGSGCLRDAATASIVSASGLTTGFRDIFKGLIELGRHDDGREDGR